MQKLDLQVGGKECLTFVFVARLKAGEATLESDPASWAKAVNMRLGLRPLP